jgi:exodeoxyribonuclease VII small subunit
MKAINELSFEEAFAEIESILTRLQTGDLKLEETVTLYERGRAIGERCQTLLDQADLRVRQLSSTGMSEPLKGQK